jgi:hypothetical protein
MMNIISENQISGNVDNVITGIHWNGAISGRFTGNITHKCATGTIALNAVKCLFSDTSDYDTTGLAITNADTPIINTLFIGNTTAMTFSKTEGHDNVKGDARGAKFVGVTTIKSRSANGAMIKFDATSIPTNDSNTYENGDIAVDISPSVTKPLAWLWSETNASWIQSGFATDAYGYMYEDIVLNSAGKGIKIKEGGTSARMGVVTLSGGTATISNASVTANTRIQVTIQSLGTVTSPKAIAVTARIPATSFTITSSDNTDTSTVAWELKEPM